MSTAIVFGNCQAGHIQHILKAHEPFASRFEVLDTPAVHVMKAAQKAEMLERAASASLVIHQPVSNVYAPADTETLVAATAAQLVSFPVLWFDAYFPDIRASKIKGTSLPYESTIIRDGFSSGKTPEDVAKTMVSDDLYDERAVVKSFNSNIQRLEERERDLDIKISTFVQNSFQQHRLFHTNNHPTDALLFWVIDQILERLEIAPLSDQVKQQHANRMDLYQWYDPPAVRRHLKLAFPAMPTFYHRGKHHSVESFAALHFENYRTLCVGAPG